MLRKLMLALATALLFSGCARLTTEPVYLEGEEVTEGAYVPSLPEEDIN